MTKILVIEDNSDNLTVMEYLLSKNGYSVFTAVDGEKGVALAKKEMPDLIICDIQMPILNGFEVVKIVKNDTKLQRIPIVAVTAYAMVGDREKILSAGFNHYMGKPINPEEFLVEIESILPAELRLTKQKID